VRIAGRKPRGHIAGVLDEPMAYPTWTTSRFLRYALNDAQAPRRPVVERLVDHDLLTRRMGRLSTGQRKLALLATVLAGDAQVVLLDEFANGLDQGARHRFREVVHDELARGRSFIATGHDLSAFGDLPTRVVVLQQGRFLDVTVDYRARKDIAQIYEKHFPRTGA
jgi:ABC-type multidrug transport system ATPase subunit